VTTFASLKDRKLSVKDFLAQGALFERELNPTQEKLLIEIDKRRRSGKKMAEFFQGYSQLVRGEPNPSQGSLFGGGLRRSKDELLDILIEQGNRPPGQIGLF
jgi:hypothetical protein